jgi:hypothetical protein
VISGGAGATTAWKPSVGTSAGMPMSGTIWL